MRLWLKLLLAFILVSLVGALLSALIARWVTVTEFERLVRQQALTNFTSDATSYYQLHGAWAGFGPFLRQRALTPPPPQPGQPPPELPPLQNGQPLLVFALADPHGFIVLPAGEYAPGQQLSAAELAAGTPLVIDGAQVATILPTGTLPALSQREVEYIERTNRALLLGSIGAVAVAILLGLVLARTLSQPLRALTGAIKAMAGGELRQQVPVRSKDEVGELTVAFNQLSADLARAAQVQQQMTADIAHDLRTPLTVIAGYLESLRDGVLPPTQARFAMLYDEAQHLQRLVEDLRLLSLADAGQLSLQRSLVNPRALLERVAATYQQPAAQQQISLAVAAPADLPRVSADPERLVQVLANLISNALRYTPPHGSITLAAAADAATLHLSVRDTGAGIEPEALAHVFDRFYRADAARAHEQGTSGLGLAIARSLVLAHGGSIAIDSAVGVGTTVALTLPLSAPPKAV